MQGTYYPGQKKSLQPRNSWGWSAVRSCDIERRFDIDATRGICASRVALQIEVDIAWFLMIALRINLMNISAVTIFLARVVFHCTRLYRFDSGQISWEGCTVLRTCMPHMHDIIAQMVQFIFHASATVLGFVKVGPLEAILVVFSRSFFIFFFCLKGLGKIWKMTPLLCACAVGITLETQKCWKKAPRSVEFNFFTNHNKRKQFSQNERRRADLQNVDSKF